MAKSTRQQRDPWEFETRVAPQMCAKPPLKPFGRTYAAPQAATSRGGVWQQKTVLLRVPSRMPTRHFLADDAAPSSAPASVAPESAPPPISGVRELPRLREQDRRPMYALLGIVFAILCWRLLPLAAARLSVVASTLSTHAEP